MSHALFNFVGGNNSITINYRDRDNLGQHFPSIGEKLVKRIRTAIFGILTVENNPYAVNGNTGNSHFLLKKRDNKSLTTKEIETIRSLLENQGWLAPSNPVPQHSSPQSTALTTTPLARESSPVGFRSIFQRLFS